MHVGIIELLRCPADHEESALVASASQQMDRRIAEGVLGCPVCGASYQIHAGVADFRAGAPVTAHTTSLGAPNDEASVRLAAQLNLSEPDRLIALFGEYATLAPALSVAYDAVCVALNAPLGDEQHIAQHASVLRIAARIPLARNTVHGAAVDDTHAARLGLDLVRELLRPNGRLVAPTRVPLPAAVTALARDDHEWVALRTAEVVPLRRASR